MKILFMCVANSARSQMAEGLARKLFPQDDIQSAGSDPKFVHPLAQAALAEKGISLQTHSSKRFDDLPRAFRENLDWIITLCAEEVCPVAVSQAKRLHWPLTDPASPALMSDPEKALNSFREVRDQIQHKLQEFQKSLSV